MTSPENEALVLSQSVWLANIVDLIDAGQIPLYLAVQMTPERMAEAWSACNDPHVLYALIVRTRKRQDALLPLARMIARTTGVPAKYLSDLLDGRLRGRYDGTFSVGELREAGRLAIYDLMFPNPTELPIAWMERAGLFRPGILDSPSALLPFLRAAGPPTLEAALRAAETSP